MNGLQNNNVPSAELSGTYLSDTSTSGEEENHTAVRPNISVVKLKPIIEKNFRLLTELKEHKYLADLLFQNGLIEAPQCKEIKKKGFTSMDHTFGENCGWEREFMHCLRQLTETKNIADRIETECSVHM